MTRGMGSGRRHGVCSDSSPVFNKVQYEHIKHVGSVHVLVSNFLGCFYQKLAKSDEIWQRCHKNKKGDVFSWDTVSCKQVSHKKYQKLPSTRQQNNSTILYGQSTMFFIWQSPQTFPKQSWAPIMNIRNIADISTSCPKIQQIACLYLD